MAVVFSKTLIQVDQGLDSSVTREGYGFNIAIIYVSWFLIVELVNLGHGH